MKKALFLVLSLFCAGFLSAQNLINPLFPHFIEMQANGADKNSIRLSELNVDVKVTSNIAVTTFDMIFTNTSDRTLEGEFEFPLAEGQTVCGFALDINGKMRDGVVVEKDKGRQVFETIVRRGVDPGLVEVTAGNNFKTRVYPFFPKDSRRVRISYQQDLKDKKYSLYPITESKLDKFTLKFTDYGANGKTKSKKGAYELKTGSVYSFEEKNFEWKNPFEITLNSQDDNLFIETLGKNTYFYGTVPVNQKSKAKEEIIRLGILYDTSLSGKNRNIEAEISLINAYIQKSGCKHVELVEFANGVKSVKSFHNENLKDIEKTIRSFTFDGATSYDDLSKTATVCTEYLLFSDGITNWGEKKALNLKSPVSTVCSSISADYNFLKKVARDNNGVFVNLNSCLEEDALKILSQESLRLVSVEYDDKAISELYPVQGSVVQGIFSYAGNLNKKDGKIKFNFGYGNTITETKTVKISAVEGIEAENVARFWAQKKIEELSLDYDSHKDEILETAKKFTIVTEGTSLIVLENVSDYVRYGIEPPEELMAEYKNYMKNQPKENNREGIPQSVFTDFEEFKKWWNLTPEELKNLKKKATSSGLSHEEMRSVREYATLADSRRLTASNRAAAAVEDFVYEDAIEMEMVNEVAMAPMAMAKSAEMGGNSTSLADSSTIKIQAWNPDSDYLMVLKKTKTEDMYGKYLELRNDYADSPSFYMEVASYFYEEDMKNLALRIVSNMAEMNLENSDVLRAMGNKLVEFGYYEAAAQTFEKLIKIRSEVPQFYRDAALAYEKCGNYQKAVDLLYYVASRSWDGRYDQIQQIVLNEMNAIIARNAGKVDTGKIDKRLMENFPVDMRVVLTWNTDDCDIDLWVTDPDGEKCYYSNKQTALGGRISRDFTQGYGPEEFCLKVAAKGNYKIQAHYFGTHSQKILQPVVVQAEVYTKFGTSEQKCEILTLQLENVNGDFTIGEVKF